MIEQWQQFSEEISFTEAQSGSEIFTENQLISFEQEYNVSLPEEYKEFCQVFGTGVAANFCRVFCPTTWLNHQQEFLLTVVDYIEQFPSQNLINDREKIKLIRNAFMFGEDLGSYLLLWDLRTYQSHDKSCDIYLGAWEPLSSEFNEDFIFVGRSVFELFRDIIYGSRNIEIYPDCTVLPEKTFHRFNTMKTYTDAM